MRNLTSFSKPRRHTGLAAVLALIGGFAAATPSASLAATAYFADTFDLPNDPTSANDTAYNAESTLGGNIDTGLGTADRWLYFRLDTSDTSTYFLSHACAGTDCPTVGNTAWNLDFDPLDGQTGASTSMSYFFDSPADFTAGGKLALDFTSYDTLSSTVSGSVTFADSSGNSQGVTFNLPSGVQQSTPTRLLLDYSGLPVDLLSHISLMSVGFHFSGTGGSLTVDKVSTVPAPASVMLFVSGLVALGGLARRRRG